MLVFGNRIAFRVVVVVGPVVKLCVLGFDRFHPRAVLFDERHAVWHKHS